MAERMSQDMAGPWRKRIQYKEFNTEQLAIDVDRK
jgi:hypothetical protein